MTEEKKIRVLSTTVMVHDLVSAIGGDFVTSLPLIHGVLDPHSYQLVKGDDEKLHRAELVVYSGLGLEHGASLVHALQSHCNAIAVGDHIALHYPDSILQIDGIVDPHIWMDVELWSHAIDPIVEALSEIDPSLKGYFVSNANKLRSKMLAVHKSIFEKVQSLPKNRRYLITSHDAFNYFTRRYLASPEELKNNTWHKRFQAPEGLAPEGQLNPMDLQRIIEHMELYGVSVIFPESNVNPACIEKIVAAGNEKGIFVRISKEYLYGDAMKLNESSTETYLETMSHNADIICSQIGEFQDDFSRPAHSSL